MKLDTLWRIIRRLVFLFVALIVAANTIAFVILNNGFVHDWVRKEINDGFAQKYGLVVDIGMISLNALESTIQVNNITAHSMQSRDKEFAHIQQMTLGFEFFSSMKNWYPRSRFLRIADWKLDLALLDLFTGDMGEKNAPSFRIEEILTAAKNLVGSQIELRSGRLLDSRINARLEHMNVDNVFFRIGGERDSIDLSVIAEFGQTLLCLRRNDACVENSKIEAFKTNIVYLPGANVRFEQVSVVGDFGQWTANGEFQLNKSSTIRGYAFRVQGDAMAAPWFSLVGMTGHGHFGANFRIKSRNSEIADGSISDINPYAEGRVNWRGLNLSGFDIYTGTADFAYTDKTLNYKDAQIVTPHAALIEAHGSYSFEKNKSFINYAKLRDFSFAELMQGLRVPSDAIDFKMNTDDLVVRGEISPAGNKGYSLIAEGPIGATRLFSPAFETGQRFLPDCMVDLVLDTDRSRMTFRGSSVSCTDSKTGQIMPVELQTGRIDYIKSTTDFQFTAANAPASIVSYFLGEDISGNMGFRASITSSQSKPTHFIADVQVNNGRVFDLDFARLSTRLFLDKERIKCTQTEAWLNDERQSPNLVAENFEIEFNQKRISLAGKFDGELSDFFAASGRAGAAIAKDLGGQLKIHNLKLNGRLNELEKAEIDLSASATNMTHPRVNTRALDVRVFCQLGLCTGSRVFAQDIALGSAKATDPLRNSQRLSGLLSSSAIIEVESYTGKSVSLRSSVVSVPFALSADTGSTISGLLDFNAALQGGWDNWELSLRSRVDALKYGDVPLGSLALTGSSVGSGPLNLLLTGLNDQVQSRFVFDHGLREYSQIYLSLRSFDVFRYFSMNENSTLRPSVFVSGDLSLTAPSLRSSLEKFSKSVKSAQGNGEIYVMRGQLGGESFSMQSPSSLSLSQGELTYSPFLLQGKNLSLSSSGRYNLMKSEYSGRVSVGAGASLLAGLTPQISQADGEIRFDADLKLGAGVKKITGQAQLNNVLLAGRYLTPPISGINGRIIVQDSKIEIPGLSGTKGNGQVELVGTVNLDSEDKYSSDGLAMPSVAVRANIRSGQFRIPQEIFETVEATVDGQLELVGRGRPFLLNGDVKLVKGRAFRDATCQELINTSSLSSGEKGVGESESPLLQLSLNLEADNSLTLQTNCLRGRVSAGLRLTGDELSPVIAGQIRLENGQLNLLKTRFDVTRADALFDNLVRTEPRLEAQMVARIDRYNVFVGADGPLSRPRLNIWSDPSTGPDGTPLTRSTLIRMISTNRGPGDTTQTAVTQAIANGVVGLFDDPLSQAVSKITRGFVDRFELQPILEAGQSSWKARVSRELGEKFNLGLDWEPNSQSLTGEIFINESVNVLGGFDRRSSQVGSYSELKGGFRFQFGGK